MDRIRLPNKKDGHHSENRASVSSPSPWSQERQETTPEEDPLDQSHCICVDQLLCADTTMTKKKAIVLDSRTSLFHCSGFCHNPSIPAFSCLQLICSRPPQSPLTPLITKLTTNSKKTLCAPECLMFLSVSSPPCSGGVIQLSRM